MICLVSDVQWIHRCTIEITSKFHHVKLHYSQLKDVILRLFCFALRQSEGKYIPAEDYSFNCRTRILLKIPLAFNVQSQSFSSQVLNYTSFFIRSRFFWAAWIVLTFADGLEAEMILICSSFFFDWQLYTNTRKKKRKF